MVNSIKEPLAEYGIDSENFGLTYLKNGDKIFFIWTKYNSDLIHEYLWTVLWLLIILLLEIHLMSF